MSMTFIVVNVSWVYACVQTYQIVHSTCVSFFSYQLYLHKDVNKTNGKDAESSDSIYKKPCSLNKKRDWDQVEQKLFLVGENRTIFFGCELLMERKW